MLLDACKQRLSHHSNQTLMRKRNIIETTENNRIAVNKQLCVDFSSNDYLGLKKHPYITEAFIQAVKKHGVGSGASALVSGYSDEHAKTEELFAKWLSVDKAILFNSGYSANTGIISALINRTNTVFSDKLSHASLLDGIALSRAKHVRYQHCDMENFRYLAESNLPDFIVTESIFSMEGDLAPISDLTQLASQYKSGLLIDDAHGIGVLGTTGAGIVEHTGINQDHYSCLVLPLGKAFNAMGAIVAGKMEIIETILQFSRSYLFTTALPPAICGAIQAALSMIQEENWRRQKLTENIRFFASYAISKGLSLISTDETPIKSILIHDNTKVLALQKYLLEKGFYVSAIRPPTVPKNLARLRISLNSQHTQSEMMQLIDNIHIGLEI